MTVRLVMLAHGATAATRRAAFADGEGLEGAAPARMRGGVPRVDQALTSPAPAARETAAALALDAAFDADLRDLDVGRWAGRTLADVAADDPAGAAAFVADPTFAGHGGESIAALIARIGTWMAARRDARGRIIAVTHAAVVRAAVVTALGAPPPAFWRVDIAPLGGMTFSGDGRRWLLRAGDALED